MSVLQVNIPGITRITDQPVVVSTDGGPWAQHNFPCPVCKEANAMMDLGGWIFEPCTKCHERGWQLMFKPALPFWLRFLMRFA